MKPLPRAATPISFPAISGFPALSAASRKNAISSDSANGRSLRSCGCGTERGFETEQSGARPSSMEACPARKSFRRRPHRGSS